MIRSQQRGWSKKIPSRRTARTKAISEFREHKEASETDTQYTRWGVIGVWREAETRS